MNKILVLGERSAYVLVWGSNKTKVCSLDLCCPGTDDGWTVVPSVVSRGEAAPVAQEAAARRHGHGTCCGLARFLLSPYPEGSGQDAVGIVSTETCVRSEVPPGPPPGVWAESGHPWRGLWAQVTGRLTFKKLVGEGRRGPGACTGSGRGAFLLLVLASGATSSHTRGCGQSIVSVHLSISPSPVLGLVGPGGGGGTWVRPLEAVSRVPV